MTLQEAIEFNQAVKKDIGARGMPTFAIAIQLGIEALKCVERMRSLYTSGFSKPLPGETEE